MLIGHALHVADRSTYPLDYMDIVAVVLALLLALAAAYFGRR